MYTDTPHPVPEPRLRMPLFRALKGTRWLVALAGFAAFVIVLPILSVLASFLLPARADVWQHVREYQLTQMIVNSGILALGTGIGVLLIGVSSAWLVTACAFPGRRILEWLLVLPLAIPAYVYAYVYTDFLHHPGMVQTFLREVTGWGPRSYWFPEIRSHEGAILIFSLAFYPYVYLLARAAFLKQSDHLTQAARSLGASPWEGFRRISLPMARPAIVAGLALALMETLADFAAVQHFGIITFTTGIYRTWYNLGDPVLATQLAAGLLGIILLLLILERINRGEARFGVGDARLPTPWRYRLTGWRAGLAMAACGIPATLGFLLPFGLLIWLSITAGHDPFTARYAGFTLNTVLLATIAAGLAVLVALVIAYAARLRPGPAMRVIHMLSGLGYALPGTVVAVGILTILIGFDKQVTAALETTFGWSTGLVLTGSLAGLIFAYLVRFQSMSLGTMDAGLKTITPSIDAASRSLGHGPAGTLWRVHAPLLRPSLLTAGLIVFVEVMKELPATLILRPFNFDTLAIQAYDLAKDERLAEASTACLIIVAAGLAPVIVLSRTMRQKS